MERTLREPWTSAPESLLRRPVMPAIRWGAVTAGVAVGLSLQLVLALLGLASGLASSSTESGAPGLAALVWAGIGMLASACAGGFVAGRMSGLRRKSDGMLHGAVTWAVLTIVLAVLAGYAGNALLGGALGGVSPAKARDADDYGLTVVLRGMIGGDASVPDVQTLERYVRNGQREEATLLLSAMGMDPVQAATIVDQAIGVALIQPDAPSRSDMGGKANASAWVAFCGVFLALLSGMAGGLIGILGARRTVWNRSDAAGGSSIPAAPE